MATQSTHMSSGSSGVTPGVVAAQKANYVRIGENVFKEVEKVNAELFTLTYGSIVTQLIKDFEDIEEVNNDDYASTIAPSSELQGARSPQGQIDPTMDLDSVDSSEPDDIVNDSEDTSSTLLTSEDDAESESDQQHFELPTNIPSINSPRLMRTAGASGNRRTDGSRSSLPMVAAT